MSNWALLVALPAISSIAATWYNVVSKEVPEPYLDEFFHVPQAQKYCNGDYTWDPKITTPPGLYLVAKLFHPLIGCNIAALRMLNVIALCLICPLSYNILRTIRSRTMPRQDATKNANATTERTSANDPTKTLDANTALNITLFPPLFFFSALFYTDIMSTLVVLLSYSALLNKRSISGSLFENANIVIIGIVSLLFRQTNIFWVAIFPAGLTVIDALKAAALPSKSPNAMNLGEILQDTWDKGTIHDCSVQEAGLQDFILLLLTVVIAALRSPFVVLRAAYPYLILLGLFASFVVWNGSVVLGDKTAHTATIHLPQMLYIWPYIAFFSAPLVIGPVLQTVNMLLPKQFQAAHNNSFFVPRTLKLPNVPILSIFVIGAFSAVHFNTIIHPYTLADNRHYVFYVFRILRLYPAIRYLAVPIYYVCAWLAIEALDVRPNGERALKQKHEHTRPTSVRTGCTPCQISFVTIWLVTTALSVVTAPLVEPRYFIIPWIVWRLHVKSSPASLLTKGSSPGKVYDVRLGLETLWLLVIDAAITYVFLYRGFAWPSEPGKIQRFLW